MPDVLSYGVALFAAWLFGLSAWHKWSDLSFYGALVANYLGSPVPRSLVALLAAGEGALAVLLLLPATRALGLACAAGLLFAYALMMGSKLLQGRRDLRCGCAGPAAELTLSPALVLRNLICAALCLGAIAVVPAPLGMVSTLALALSVACFLVLLYLCCEQLLDNAQRLTGGY
ncbi:MAG: MauE/DoxX family redox-associated membrane protein [Parahaliea sp.]